MQWMRRLAPEAGGDTTPSPTVTSRVASSTSAAAEIPPVKKKSSASQIWSKPRSSARAA